MRPGMTRITVGATGRPSATVTTVRADQLGDYIGRRVRFRMDGGWLTVGAVSVGTDGITDITFDDPNWTGSFHWDTHFEVEVPAAPTTVPADDGQSDRLHCPGGDPVSLTKNLRRAMAALEPPVVLVSLDDYQDLAPGLDEAGVIYGWHEIVQPGTVLVLNPSAIETMRWSS